MKTPHPKGLDRGMHQSSGVSSSSRVTEADGSKKEAAESSSRSRRASSRRRLKDGGIPRGAWELGVRTETETTGGVTVGARDQGKGLGLGCIILTQRERVNGINT